jgi:hypothetical protein
VQKTRSAVRIEGTLSSFFENKTGLKQGDREEWKKLLRMARNHHILHNANGIE